MYRFFAARFLQSSGAIHCSGDREPCFAQVEREKIDNIASITDNQNPPAGCRFYLQSDRRNYFDSPAKVSSGDCSKPAATPVNWETLSFLSRISVWRKVAIVLH